MATHHVIVGGGPAALAAVETLRALEPEARLTLVADEAPYARMVLPYYLTGKVGEPGLMRGDADWFAGLGVETLLGRRAESIDAAGHRLTLEDGSTLPYDRLLVATGSRAARPASLGPDRPGVGAMWTLADARSFLSSPHRRTVVVGAGFIAFTVLDALASLGESLDFVELESQILPHMLDPRAAALFADHLVERGVRFHTGARVTGVEAGADGARVVLDGGESLGCDAVVIAAGVHPNLALFEGSGVEIDHGVLVDGHMRSNVPDLFAAGDVAQGPILHGTERRVQAIQPTAIDHGRVAAANMAGRDVAYAGSLTMNILAARGHEAASFGRWSDDSDTLVVENPADRIYRKYVFEGDVVVGGIAVGPTAAVSGINDVGMLKGLVQTGVPLGSWRRYLEENPLDLRRVYVASGAARALLGHTLLAGRVESPGRFRFPRIAPHRPRSPHHATLLAGREEASA